MKVYYFPVYARGEPIRMMLTHAKQPFEDNRIQMGDWGSMKNNTSMFEFGQMPMVELENGQRITQTKSILRSLGQKYGYYTSDPKEAWVIDSTMDATNEMFELFAIPILGFCPPEKKPALLFELLTKQLPTFLERMEKRVSGKKFVCGDRITCADFLLGGLLTNTLGNENNPHYYAFQHILKSYPGVSKYIENFVEANKEYLAKRPAAPL